MWGFIIARLSRKVSIFNPFKMVLLIVLLIIATLSLQLVTPRTIALPVDTVFWPFIAGVGFVLSINYKLNDISIDTTFFRHASTFIFVAHFLIIKLVGYLSPFILTPVSVMTVTVFVSVVMYLCLKRFKFSRYLI